MESLQIKQQMKMPSNIHNFENKWVALDLKRESIITSGATIKEADQKAGKITKNPENYILSFIPDSKHTYSP